MKYFASLCILLLAGSMTGFATSAHPTSLNLQNQFHFQPTGRRAAQIAAHDASARQAHDLGGLHIPGSKIGAHTDNAQGASAKNVRRQTANPPTGKIGFLSAIDIPAGGETENAALSGDFNGDGKTDIAAEVYAYNSTTDSYYYAISVVLSNGDGTFKPAVLNTITDNCSALLVADVNGDGKSDLIVGHAGSTCGNLNTNPAFDVWLSNGDGTFTLSSNTNNTIPTNGLSGGTIADVNSDGKLDLVLVDNNNPASVWTLLGNGDGTFQTPTSVALSGEVGYDIVVADLNGDGILDIADNDLSSNQLTVYLATSPTTYGSAISYATSDSNYYACSMAAGDLNGDGKPELVNVNCTDSGNNVTIYVNNGDGTFATGVYYDGAMSGGTNSGAANVYTAAVTVADVNGDGQGDIVATNGDSSDITILLGNGDGTVKVPTVGYAIGGYAYAPAIVADFNGDGIADIVVPDDAFSFAYLKGYGDGTFRAALNYYAATTTYGFSYGVATGDFNKDGHPDFVAANYCPGCTLAMGVTVFLSNPDGSMQPGVNFGTTSYFLFVAVADFNGDGNLDIAATDAATGQVQLFNGDGTGNFTVGSSFNTDLANNEPLGIYVGDFNNDGHPDLAIANYNGSDIAILLNDGSGNFPAPVPTALSSSVSEGFAVADINGDGNLDLVAPLYNDSSIAVLLGKGDGTFQAEQDVAIGASYPWQLVLADLNGDGKLDVAVTLDQGSGQDIAYAMGNGDGTFGTFSIVPSSLQAYQLRTPYPEGIQVTDVDGDGKPDLVYANSNYSTVGVLFGQGNGTFFDPVEYPVGEYNLFLVATDINGDGALDLVSDGRGFSGVTVLLNNNGANTLGSYTVQPDATGQTVTAGQTATFTLTITPSNHYNGTVTFACPSGLPQLATCSFSPASVTLDGLTPVTVTLTITTTASMASLQNPAGIEPHGNSHSTMLLASLNEMGVFGMILAGSFSKKRNRWSVLGLLVLGMTLFLVGCGGYSSSTGTPPPTKSSTTSSVTSSAPTVLVGQAVTFTGTVSATSGIPTGMVNFLDGTTSLGTGTLSSGKATFQTSALAAGMHRITIAYGGDSSFNSSTSTQLSQTVDTPGTTTGSYTVTVSGTGTAGTNGVGKPNQSIKLSVVVQ
jgi:Bacterial Ig-like domain (group 3)/FG-GAP-like repeat